MSALGLIVLTQRRSRADGECHLNRNTLDAIGDADFSVDIEQLGLGPSRLPVRVRRFLERAPPLLKTHQATAVAIWRPGTDMKRRRSARPIPNGIHGGRVGRHLIASDTATPRRCYRHWAHTTPHLL